MPRSSNVTITVPSPLQKYVGGASELPSSASNVRGALTELERTQPELHRCVCDETGAVRRHINLFVNSDNVKDVQGLDTPLAPGDVLTIMPAVSGG